MKISEDLVKQIKKDFSFFNNISDNSKKIISETIKDSNIELLDKFLLDLGKKFSDIKNLEDFLDNLDNIMKFLLNFGNFLIKKNIKIDEIINIFEPNEVTKEALENIFNNNSNFLKSIKISSEIDEKLDKNIEVTYSNSLLVLNFNKLLKTSVLNIKTDKQEINLNLNIEDLKKISEEINKALDNAKEFNNDFTFEKYNIIEELGI